MPTRKCLLASTLLAFGSFFAAFPQAPAGSPADTVTLTGRIVDSENSPLPGINVNWREAAPRSSPANNIVTDARGRFAFSIPANAVCELTLAHSQNSFANVAIVEVAHGESADLGDIELDTSAESGPVADMHSPVVLGDVSPGGRVSIAAIYISSVAIPNESYMGGVLHILLSDGHEVRPEPEKEQVGTSSPRIADDRRHAGWLADYANCCTSYPLSHRLVLFRPDHPALSLTGNGMALFSWHFLDHGSKVAFYQDLPHGASASHYELHDTDTGRLLDKWDGDITSAAPAWVQSFRPAPSP